MFVSFFLIIKKGFVTAKSEEGETLELSSSTSSSSLPPLLLHLTDQTLISHDHPSSFTIGEYVVAMGVFQVLFEDHNVSEEASLSSSPPQPVLFLTSLSSQPMAQIHLLTALWDEELLLRKHTLGILLGTDSSRSSLISQQEQQREEEKEGEHTNTVDIIDLT